MGIWSLFLIDIIIIYSCISGIFREGGRKRQCNLENVGLWDDLLV